MESRGFSESDEEPNGSSVADGTPAKSQGPDLQKMIRKIAAFAAQRRLNDAVKAFGEISAKGLEPSVQAYASLINAHVNSGDMSGAADVFKKMLSDGLRSNVVVCTALLKGYCRAGDVPGAMEVLQSMLSQEPPVKPDLRLINTLLRGCLRVGDLKTAEGVFKQLPSWQLQPDATSCTFMGSLLSQSLRAKSIGELLRSPPLAEPNSSDGPTASSAAQQEACRFWAKGKCSKGSACPFFHDPKVAEAKVEFREPERLSAVASVSLHLAWALALSQKSSSSVKSAVEKADLALRATKERPVAKKSLRETQESQQREQELEVQLLRDWLARGKSSTKGSVATIDFLGRCFVMPVVKAKNQALDAELVSQLEPWGVKRFSLAARKSLRQRFSSCLDATGHLLWKELFGSGKVKLESGSSGNPWLRSASQSWDFEYPMIEFGIFERTLLKVAFLLIESFQII